VLDASTSKKPIRVRFVHDRVGSARPGIFSADAAYNIAYAGLDASEDDIRAAARAAHADEFLSALPQGYAL